VLLGRGGGGGAGTVQELTLGAGLSLAGTVLSATATPTLAAGSANEVQFRDSGTGAFDADAGFAYDKTNHRLGVGIAAPSEKLQVKFGNVALDNAYKLKWGSSEIYGYDGTGGYINFRANGNQNLYLQDGGSVGVGTTSLAAGPDIDRQRVPRAAHDDDAARCDCVARQRARRLQYDNKRPELLGRHGLAGSWHGRCRQRTDQHENYERDIPAGGGRGDRPCQRVLQSRQHAGRERRVLFHYL
jgi:hypothetical protein